MSNTANDYYRAGVYIRKEIDQHQNDIDYLIIVNGMLLEEQTMHGKRWFKREHARLLRGMRRHAKEIKRLNRRYRKVMTRYRKQNRKEGWS